MLLLLCAGFCFGIAQHEVRAEDGSGTDAEAKVLYEAEMQRWKSLRSGFKGLNIQRQFLNMDHAMRLQLIANKTTGEFSDRALVDAARYLDFGGDHESYVSAIGAVFRRDLSWDNLRLALNALDTENSFGDGLFNSTISRMRSKSDGDPEKVRITNEIWENYRLAKEMGNGLRCGTTGPPMDDYMARSVAREWLASTRFPVPMFELPGLEPNETIRLENFRGGFVLIHVWATWFPSTLNEFAKIKEYQKEFGDRGLKVIGICLDTDRELARKTAHEYGAEWPHVCDGLGTESEPVIGFVTTAYEGAQLPYRIMLINPRGYVVLQSFDEEYMHMPLNTALPQRLYSYEMPAWN